MDDEMNGQNLRWDEIDDGAVVPLYDEPPAWMDEASDAVFRQEESPREPLPLIDPSDWGDQDPPERRWTVDGMVPHGQATLLTGAGSAGKSLVQQLQCTCVALGLPWLGIETEQANAIYISCEDDTNELWRRQKAICAGLGVTLADLKGKLWLLSLAGMIDNELATFDERGRTHIADRYRDIQDACSRVEARFVALDNTGHFFSGNENDRHQVASFIGLGNALAAHIDGSVVIIGHPNKAGAQYSGSTAWENQVRSRLFMEIPTDEDGNAADPDVRVITRGKSNYAQKGGELRFRWYQWTFVLDDQIPEPERVSIAQVAQANAENERFLHCLRLRTEQRRAVSEQEASPTYAPRVFAKMDAAKGMKVEAFKRAMDALFLLEHLERGVLPWDKSRGHPAEGLRLTASHLRTRNSQVSEIAASLSAPHIASDLRTTSGAKTGAGRGNGASDLASDPASDTPPYTTYMAGPALEERGPAFDPGEPPSWMDEVPRDDDADADAWMRNPLLNPDFGKDA